MGHDTALPSAPLTVVETGDGYIAHSASAVSPHDMESLIAALSAPDGQPAALDARTARNLPHADDDTPAADTPADDDELEGATSESQASPGAAAAIAAAQAAKTTPEATPKKKQTATERHEELQARIHAATREENEAKARIDALKAEERQLEERRRARESGEPAKPAAAAAPPAATDPKPKAPKWTAFDAEGKTYEEYEAAVEVHQDQLADWLVRQNTREAEAAARRAEELVEHARRQAAHDTRIEAARAKHADFDTVIATNLGTKTPNPYLTALVRELPAGPDIFYALAQEPALADVVLTQTPTRPIFEAIESSPDPTALVLHFARNPQEFDTIARLAPAQQLLRLGALTASLGAKNGSPKAPPVTHAAPPLSHRASGHARTAAPAASDSSGDELLDEFREENKAEGRAYRF